MSLQALTANRLVGGLVVFLARGGRWTDDLNEAALATSKEEAAQLEAEAAKAKAENIIVDPYLIDLARAEDGSLKPTKYREYLRTLGPTVRTDLGYQAERATTRKSA